MKAIDNNTIESHIAVNRDGRTALEILSENHPTISKQQLKKAMQYGAVWISRSSKLNPNSQKTSRLRQAKKRVNIGDELHFYYNPSILFSEVPQATLLADEKEYSIWKKPSGMFSQGSKWGDHSAITRWIEIWGLKQNQLDERQCFLVHRLDRATQGIILVAHSHSATRQLTELFEKRKITKRYRALINNELSAMLPLTIAHEIDGKKAVSHIISSRIIQFNSKKVNEITIEIETGRKHQIRKHLASIGYPIIGDRLYGDSTEDLTEDSIDLQLTACFLSFECPMTHQVKTFEIE